MCAIISVTLHITLFVAAITYVATVIVTMMPLPCCLLHIISIFNHNYVEISQSHPFHFICLFLQSLNYASMGVLHDGLCCITCSEKLLPMAGKQQLEIICTSLIFTAFLNNMILP